MTRALHWLLVLALVACATPWGTPHHANADDVRTVLTSATSQDVTALAHALRSEGCLEKRLMTLHRMPVSGRVVTVASPGPAESDRGPHRPPVFRRKCPQISTGGDPPDGLA